MNACAQCGHENRPEARFCDACGSSLITRPSAPVREERKVVTVLFADLVGFTSRAEQLDPEDVRRLLQPYYARLRRELERRGGTVEKFIGDAVMALFGAPVVHEDDPERAVRAALAIRDAVAEEDLGPGGGQQRLEVRIAVNTGEALVALDARPDEGEGMASGDVVNSAARMQTAAPVNGILVGESTYRATKHVFDYRSADPIYAKGKSEPVPVWEAVTARSRFGLDVDERPRTAMVGRERELGTLVDTLERVQQQRSPQLVTLVGVPGIGKSRLVAEFFQVVDEQAELILWRQGRSLPYGEDLSYWALAEIVKAQAGIAENDPEEAASEKLREAIDAAVLDAAEAAWIEGHLRPLVGLSTDVGGSPGTNTDVYAAWRRFFEGLADQRPLILVFEDLHWADDGLLDFVDHLVDWASGVPLLVVCMARPELFVRRPGWGGGKRNAAAATIEALSSEDTARLLAGLLGQTLLPADVQASLLARADGNPLYAQEYVRMLRDRGLLQRDGPGWGLSNSEDLPLPETVQGTIAARVDALPLEEKDLVQHAAVVGKVFWPGALASMSGRDVHTIEPSLHALERKEFIRREHRSVVTGEHQFAFLHVLVRDVAYAQIPRARRADAHRRTAEWIASLASDRTEDRAEMLAHHYAEALELTKAAGVDGSALVDPAWAALDEAGERALALNNAAAALRLSRRALELVSPDDARCPGLLLRIAQANWQLGDFDIRAATRAVDAIVATGDRELAAVAMAMLADYHFVLMENDLALERHAEAVRYVEDLSASPVKARVEAEFGRRLYVAGELERGTALARRALVTAQELGLDDVASSALNTIGMARSHAGDDGGIADLKRSAELAIRANSPDRIIGAYNNLANVLWGYGRLRDASEQLRLARAAAERFGNLSGLRWLDGEDVLDLTIRGEWNEASQRADAFIAACQESPHYLEGSARLMRVSILLGLGDREAALEDSHVALQLARSVRDPTVVQATLVFRARALLAADLRSEADEMLDELMAYRPNLAEVWMKGLARVMLDVGREQEVLTGTDASRGSPWLDAEVATAERRFEEAARIYEAVGARADEAEARMAAAHSAAHEGRRADAERQLSRALAFYRSVGATEYVRRGEALLAATA